MKNRNLTDESNQDKEDLSSIPSIPNKYESISSTIFPVSYPPRLCLLYDTLVKKRNGNSRVEDH